VVHYTKIYYDSLTLLDDKLDMKSTTHARGI